MRRGLRIGSCSDWSKDSARRHRRRRRAQRSKASTSAARMESEGMNEKPPRHSRGLGGDCSRCDERRLNRTADAVGAAGIILLQGTVDVFSPKVVRSSMGSLFHVQLCGPVSETEMAAWCRKQGYRLAATTLKNSRSIYESDLTGKLALIIGNEANGVSATLLQQAEQQLHIPMPGRAESLNAAQAAGIILFESLRQRLGHH